MNIAGRAFIVSMSAISFASCGTLGGPCSNIDVDTVGGTYSWVDVEVTNSGDTASRVTLAWYREGVKETYPMLVEANGTEEISLPTGGGDTDVEVEVENCE